MLAFDDHIYRPQSSSLFAPDMAMAIYPLFAAPGHKLASVGMVGSHCLWYRDSIAKQPPLTIT
jgi:hypothetical protein